LKAEPYSPASIEDSLVRLRAFATNLERGPGDSQRGRIEGKSARSSWERNEEEYEVERSRISLGRVYVFSRERFYGTRKRGRAATSPVRVASRVWVQKTRNITSS